MVISASEEELVSALRKLPPETAEGISALVHRLASLPPNASIDWSDEWSASDLREYSEAALRSFEDPEKQN